MESKGIMTPQAQTEGVADTTIPIDSDTRDRLRAEKVGNETYSDVIERLIESNE
jgi:predicted CopG family antitoxin